MTVQRSKLNVFAVRTFHWRTPEELLWKGQSELQQQSWKSKPYIWFWQPGSWVLFSWQERHELERQWWWRKLKCYISIPVCSHSLQSYHGLKGKKKNVFGAECLHSAHPYKAFSSEHIVALQYPNVCYILQFSIYRLAVTLEWGQHLFLVGIYPLF